MGVTGYSREYGQRIDFSCSSVRWITKEIRSHGAFSIESVLRILARDGHEEESFALGAGVLAGNMYVPQGLVKQPLYHFQLAASAARHVIYRTYAEATSGAQLASAARPAENDTSGLNEQVFELLDFHIARENAHRLEAYADIAHHYERHAVFTAVIGFPLARSRRMELEFPVKHLNLLPQREMFQVETGPVLFADLSARSAELSVSARELSPCFVHFNRFDYAEITPYLPFDCRPAQTRGEPIRALSCDISLLVDHPEH